MTTRRSALTALAGAAALTCGGFALSAAPASASPAPSAAAARCDRAPWEAKIQGMPKGFKVGAASGDYLWHSATGFHLRVTHAKHDQRVYSGIITSSAPMRIEPVRLEKGDAVTLSASHRTISFVFANHGGVDGVNFHTDCARTLTVSRLHVGSSDLPASQVRLGYTKAHPSKVPFSVHRYGA